MAIDHCDILIKSGSVIDGTGAPFFHADVAVKEGKIVRLEKNLQIPAARTIHAKKLVISPGFIDAHAHDDLYLLVHPEGAEKLLQGVTTTVIGNCGISVAPMCEATREDLHDLLRFIGAEHVEPSHLSSHSFEEFLGKLEAVNPALNVAGLIGHATLRIASMGSVERSPDDGEMENMKALAAQAMGQGALGMSSGLIYAPGSYAGTEELVELAKAIAPYGGLYASHIRSEGDDVLNAVKEAIRIGERAGLAVHISHHKTAGRRNWGRSRETLACMLGARERGIEVTCDQYPYDAACTFLASVLPPSILAGGPEVFREKLKEPEVRQAVIAEIQADGGGGETLIRGASTDGIYIASSFAHPEYCGRSLTEISQTEGRSPYDIVMDLAVEEGRETSGIFFSMSEEDIRRIMRSPITMIGSDGIPGLGGGKFHPRFTGTFPRVLGRYVRQQGILKLEEAVRKMTSLPARTFNLKNKGLVKEGFDADLTVFDPETVIDRSTYDNPGLAPKGIEFVLVNGTLALDQGRLTDQRAGLVLRRR